MTKYMAALAWGIGIPHVAVASMCFGAAEIFFPEASATLADSDLERVLSVIEEVQAKNTVVAVVVDGHADQSEANPSVDLLARARAGTVAYAVLQLGHRLAYPGEAPAREQAAARAVRSLAQA